MITKRRGRTTAAVAVALRGAAVVGLKNLGRAAVCGVQCLWEDSSSMQGAQQAVWCSVGRETPVGGRLWCGAWRVCGDAATVAKKGGDSCFSAVTNLTDVHAD